jgi:hypothetical protein
MYLQLPMPPPGEHTGASQEGAAGTSIGSPVIMVVIVDI